MFDPLRPLARSPSHRTALHRPVTRALRTFISRGLTVGLAVLLVPAPALQAGMFTDDEARAEIEASRQDLGQKINQLLRQLDELSDQVKMQRDANSQGSSQQVLDLISQQDSLSQQLAVLRGQLEVLNFNQQTFSKRQQDLFQELDRRLRALEGGASPAAINTAPAYGGRSRMMTPAEPAAARSASDDAMTAYNGAYDMYRAGSPRAAIDAMNGVLHDFPDDARIVPDALFWLGMAQAQNRQGTEAIASWRKLVSTYPNHPKTPIALKAISDVQTSRSDDLSARKTMEQLMTRYPDSDAALEAEHDLRRLLVEQQGTHDGAAEPGISDKKTPAKATKNSGKSSESKKKTTIENLAH